MFIKSFQTIAAVGTVLLGSALAQAGTITSVNIISGVGNAGLGSYTGSITYDNDGLLTISLTNTTDPGIGGFITGFLFNINGNATATLSPSPQHFFQNTGSENGAPYGTFEAGAALGGNFLGGGNPNFGIGVGNTGTFTFNVTGSDKSSLTAQDFITQISSQGDKEAAFLVRFKGMANNGSDKVPGVMVPLPSAAAAGLTLLGALGARCGLRRPRKQQA